MSAGVVWALLVLLTAGSLAVVEGGLVRLVSAAVVIGLAAYKARLVMLHFMEIKTLPGVWKKMYTMWIVAAVGIILIGNYVAVLST
jgi:heme/copper-type cytochrome/quinol oxidase subunit 4